MATVDELILRLRLENLTSRDIAQIIRQMRDLDNQTDQTGQRGRSMFSSLNQAAGEFAVTLGKTATKAAFDFAKTSVQKLAEFENAMAGPARTTGLVDEELKQLSDSLRQFSAIDLKGNIKAEDLATISEAAGQLGVQGLENIQAFTKDVAMIAVATDESADRVGTDLARIAKIFQESLEQPRVFVDEFGNKVVKDFGGAFQQIGNIGSALNEISQNTAANTGELLNMMNRMAGAGKTMGLTVDQLIGVAGTLRDTVPIGIEKTSTAMNKLMLSMIKDTGSYIEAFKLDAAAFKTAIETDPMRALEMLAEGMGKLKETEGPKALTLAIEQLLGKGDGITQLALGLAGSQEKLRETAGIVSEAFRENVSVINEFEVATSTQMAKWEGLKGKMDEVYRTGGEVFKPLTNAALDFAHKGIDVVLQGLNTWRIHKDKFIAEFKAGFAGLLGKETFESLISGDLSGAVETLKARIATALVDSPFQPLFDAAVTTVQGITDQFTILQKTAVGIISQISQGDYSGAFGTLIDGIQDSVQLGIQFFQDLGTSAQELIGNLAAQFADTPVGPAIEEIGKLATNVIETLKTLSEWGGKLFEVVFTKEHIEGTIGVAISLIGSLAQTINMAIEGLQGMGTLLGEIFAGDITIDDLLGGLKQLAGEAGNWILEQLSTAAETALNFVTSKIQEAFDAILQIVERMVQAVEAALASLTDKIVAPFRKANEEIQGILAKLPGLGEAKGASTRTASGEQNIQGLISSLQNLRTSNDSAFDQSEELRTAYGSLYKELAGAADKSIAPNEALRQQFEALQQQIQAVGDTAVYKSVFPDMQVAIEQSSVSIQALGTQFGSLASQMDAMLPKLQELLRLQTTTATGAMGTSGGTITTYNKWGLASQKDVGGLSAQAIENMQDLENRKQYKKILREWRASHSNNIWGVTNWSGFQEMLAKDFPGMLAMFKRFGTSDPAILHQGGPALGADEIPAILQRGEFVLSRSDVSAVQHFRHEPILRKVRAARFHEGGPVTEQSSAASASAQKIEIHNHYQINGQVIDRQAFQNFVREISREQKRQGALVIQSGD